MAARLLSLAGDLVRSINPSLLKAPPPAAESTGRDVCYLGPRGEDGPAHVTYCADLPDGLRAMVGSWYLPPERHAVECAAFVVASALAIRALLPSLPRIPEARAGGLDPPALVKGLTLVVYACQVAYKVSGYPGKVLFMAMPCNVLWTMWAALCFLPLGTQTRHVLYQLIIPYTGLSVVAVATPDTSDLTMWMEVPFFFFVHAAQIAYPVYFLRSGRISALAEGGDGSGVGVAADLARWWALACAYFALFYFGLGVPLSLAFGINLNYMLSPPPTPGDFVSGPNFRLQSTLCCAAAFFLVRLAVTAAELLARARRKSPSAASKKGL